MKKTVLRKYAKLIAVMGANVQKGQDVFIEAGLDQPEFVQMVVEECYKLKARKVVVNWGYAPLTKVNVRYRSVKTLGTVDSYELERYKYFAEKLPARIYLDSDDPDAMKGVNQGKMAKGRQLMWPIVKPIVDQAENKYQWTIAAVPGKKWAKKMFPELTPTAAVERLWKEILKTVMVSEDNDPIEAWKKHNKDIKDHCAKLNSLKIEKLHYTSKNGTDFTVGMIPEARFCGSDETTIGGVVFNPNMPTEESFISPMRGEAEGIVYATKPLSYQGQMIENFNIRFEGGKAVEWHAEKGEDLLTYMINMDEGSAYLGECALVPYESPICRSGLLFYNTLFDENAACHLALGMGFADTIEDFHNKTLDECRALGVNDSMIHVDFMIGSEDMNIDAICADGKTVAIFRNGNWAI